MIRRSYQPILITFLLATFPFVLLSVPDRRAVLLDLASVLPYLIAALIGFLTLKLHQRRLFFLALFIAGVYAFLHEPWLALGFSVAERARALTVIVPLALLTLFLVPEPRPIYQWTAYLAALLAPSLGVLAAARFAAPKVAVYLDAKGTGISLVLLFTALSWFARDRFLRDFRIFVALSLLPLFYVLARASRSNSPSWRLEVALGFFSVGTILTYAIFRLYWQKVYVDELTGIPNRRALNERLQDLKRPFAVAMTDIDFFKRFNDTFGHEEGDNVLRYVGKHLDRETGAQAYRYGGEEFCLVFEGKSAIDATKLCDGIRKRLSAREFHIRSPKKVRDLTSEKDRAFGRSGKEGVTVTVSIGIAGDSESLHRPEDVLIAADAALYRAKSLGRDRVLMAQIGGNAPRQKVPVDF